MGLYGVEEGGGYGNLLKTLKNMRLSVAMRPFIAIKPSVIMRPFIIIKPSLQIRAFITIKPFMAIKPSSQIVGCLSKWRALVANGGSSSQI